MFVPGFRMRRPLTRFRFVLGLALGATAAIASACAYFGVGPIEARDADELAGAAVAILTVVAVHTRAYGIRG